MRYRAGHRSCAPAREVQENWLHGRRQAAAGRWIHVPILGQQISQRRHVDLPFRARQRGAQETFREGSLSSDGEKANPPAVPSKGCRPTQQYWRLPDFGSGQASQHTQGLWLPSTPDLVGVKDGQPLNNELLFPQKGKRKYN